MRRRLVGVLFMFIGLNAFSQRVMTPEILWSLGRVSIDDVSLNGDSILYGVTYYNIEENKGNRQLYLYTEVAGVSKTVQVTQEDKSVANGVLLPDSKIGYLKGGEFYIKNLLENDAKKASSVDGIILLKFSKNFDRVLYVKDVKVYNMINEEYPQYPKANVLAYDKLNYMDWDHFEDEFANHIFYSDVADDFSFDTGVDIMEGEVFESPLKPFGGAEQINWSPNAKSIAYSCKKMDGVEFATSTNSDIYIYSIETQSTTNITEGMMGYDIDPMYSPDGKYIAWLSMEEDGYESDMNKIFIQDLSSGKQMDLTKNYPETVYSFRYTPDGKSVQFLSPTQATKQYFSINIPKKIKENAKVFYRPLTTGDHDYTSIYSCTNAIIGTRTTMNKANEIYRVDLSNGKQEMLSNVNGKTYEAILRSKIDKRWVKTSDGKDMLTWVVYPPKFDPSKKYPTLLYCGGGPQNVISQSYSFRWNFQVMAAQGYIVVVPNRRGLPSFGEEWNAEISLDWGGQPMDDYLSAIDSIAKEPYVDNDNMGAVGASYGGYSVFYLAGIHEGRFKAFIAHDGVFDFASMYGTTEQVFFADHEWGGPPWQDPQPESYSKFSPSIHVANWDTPILIIHGMKDYRVSISQSQQAFQAAQLLGVPSKFLIFPDENHWVLKPQNSLIWYSEFYRWLDKWLK